MEPPDVEPRDRQVREDGDGAADAEHVFLPRRPARRGVAPLPVERRVHGQLAGEEAGRVHHDQRPEPGQVDPPRRCEKDPADDQFKDEHLHDDGDDAAHGGASVLRR